MLETNGSGIPQASYVLGNDALLAQTRGGTTSYYLDDGQGSVRDLTNSSGLITAATPMMPFGNLQSSTGGPVNPYLYTGQQFDSLTGLYDLRARYYDPTTGRFTSQDTAGIDFSNPVELNRYNYAQENPVNFTDPSGHDAVEEGELYATILGAARTIGAGIGRVIPGLTEEEIAILLAGLGGALGLWFLLHWLATHALALPRSGAISATPTPSSACPDFSEEADYDVYPSVHGLVRGLSTDRGTPACHINAEVGYKFQPAPEQQLTNLHIHYTSVGEFTSNGTPIGTCNDSLTAALAVS